MIDVQLIEFGAVLVESIGILLVDKKTSIALTIATILTIIIFFMT